MAQLTASQIVSEGLKLAQRDGGGAETTQALAWLNRWLDSVAGSFPWPILHREATGISLPSGTAPLILGNGNGTITNKVLAIKDNVWCYLPDMSQRSRVRIRNQLAAPMDRIMPSTNVGTPYGARVFQTVFGQWDLYFEPYPNQQFLLSVPYLVLPPQVTLGDTPWYYNDETMVQAVAFKANEFYNGKANDQTQAAQELVAAQLTNDRIRYGQVNGVNDNLFLDPAVFKPNAFRGKW